jgi:hypothetical protein
MNNEAFLTIRGVFKVIDKVLKLLDPGELFFNSKITNLNQRFLMFNSYIDSTLSDSVLHVHRVSLVFYTIESLSSEHSTKHHHVRRTLPAVQNEYTLTVI